VPESEKIPHMVTFDHTTGFYRRYDDGKKEMTIGEIRDAFSQYDLGKSRDGRIFQESHEILEDRGMRLLIEELEDSSEYDTEDREILSDFCDFFKDPNNRYVQRDIRASCQELTDSITQLIEFFDNNYYDTGGYYRLSIYPETGLDLEEEVLSPEDEARWEQLNSQKLELTQQVSDCYERYRRTVKSVLPF